MAGDMEVLFKKPLQALQLAQRTRKGVNEVLKRGSFRVERAAKRSASVNYGILRGAIQAVQDAALLWSIGTRGLAHAKFIEFGTGPAGAASSKITAVARDAMNAMGYKHGVGGRPAPVAAVALWAKRKGIPDEMVWPIARAIGRRGIHARPFLFPAFEKERPRIIKAVADAVKKALAGPGGP